MAYRARTCNGQANNPNGKGETIVIDGLVFTAKDAIYEGEPKTFRYRDGAQIGIDLDTMEDEEIEHGDIKKVTFGVPPKSVLTHPNIIVEDLSGQTFPGCYADTNAKGEGHHFFFLRQKAGLWPTPEEVECQERWNLRMEDEESFREAAYEEQALNPGQVKMRMARWRSKQKAIEARDRRAGLKAATEPKKPKKPSVTVKSGSKGTSKAKGKDAAPTDEEE